MNTLAPDALQTAGWLASAFFLAGGLNQVLKLVDRTREQPPPAQTYATKAEQQQRFEDTLARIERLENRTEQHGQECRADLQRLQQRLDAVAADLNRQLQALPRDLAATLRAARNLK